MCPILKIFELRSTNYESRIDKLFIFLLKLYEGNHHFYCDFTVIAYNIFSFLDGFDRCYSCRNNSLVDLAYQLFLILNS